MRTSLLVAAALGGERGRLGLEADAKLEQRQDLGERRRIDALDRELDRAGGARARERSDAALRRDHAARAKLGDRLAHDRAAHAEFGDELALAGKLRAGRDRARRDARAELRDHLLGQAGRFGERSVRHGLPAVDTAHATDATLLVRHHTSGNAEIPCPKRQLPRSNACS
jgi:hypothetical protein